MGAVITSAICTPPLCLSGQHEAFYVIPTKKSHPYQSIECNEVVKSLNFYPTYCCKICWRKGEREGKREETVQHNTTSHIDEKARERERTSNTNTSQLPTTHPTCKPSSDDKREGGREGGQVTPAPSSVTLSAWIIPALAQSTQHPGEIDCCRHLFHRQAGQPTIGRGRCSEGMESRKMQ